MSRITEKTKPEFLPSFGNKPMEYVGREQNIQEISKALTSYPGSRDRAILITGQRGYGKTALLLEIADKANEQDFVVAHVSAGKSMLDDIIERLQVVGARYLSKEKWRLSGLKAGAFGLSLGVALSDKTKNDYGFRTKLELICDKLNKKNIGVLILVDEVQPNSEEMRTLISTYQHLAGAEKNIALIMAGLPHIVSNILNEKSLTFFNRATKIKLGAVPTERIHVYYEKAFERAERIASTEVLRDAANSTQGFPYLLQLIGYFLMEYSKESKLINESTLEKAKVSSDYDLKDKIFKPALKPLSPRDLDFLKAMAKDNSATSVADIAERMNVGNGTVQKYRQRLIEHGIISSPRRGYIEFCIPYLKDYLKQDP